MSSANVFKLDWSQILSFGNGLKTLADYNFRKFFCKMCEIILDSQIVGSNSGRMYNIPSNVNCKQKNEVVYAISCKLVKGLCMSVKLRDSYMRG